MSSTDQEFKELAKAYITKVKSKSKFLKRLISEEEGILSIKVEAHKLKGSGKGYGFHAISHLGDRIETECEKILRGGLKEESPGNLKAPINQIKRNLDELYNFCEQVERDFEGKTNAKDLINRR